MKQSLKPVIFLAGILLAVTLLVTAVIFFIPRDNTSFSWECFRLRLAVSDFLKDVEKEHYEDAFARVYRTDADGSFAEYSETLQKAWIQRVESLRKGSNTYLKDHSKLKVRKENGVFTVTVVLSVMRQGYNDPFYARGNTLSVVYDDGWKISAVSDYEIALQTDLEKALSGRFSSAEFED